MGYELFEATLGGVDFSSLADELILLDIVEEPAQMDTQTAQRALGSGMIRMVNRRKSLSVRIVYQIRTQDVVRRAAVRDLVAEWSANGGSLEINSRPGKVLPVVMDAVPAIDSNADWSKDLTMTLTAYAMPYWRSKAGAGAQIDTVYVSSENVHYKATVITPKGNAGAAPATATVVNAGTAPLTYLKILAGKTFFEFEGFNIPSGGVVMITYDVNGLLDVRGMVYTRDESLLPYRTADSSDDLLLEPNVDNQIIVWADSALTGMVYGMEWWV